MMGVSIHGTGMTTDDVIKKAHDTLPVATSSAAGVVKIGSGIDVTGDGTISVSGGGGGGGSGVGFTQEDAHDLTLTAPEAASVSLIAGADDLTAYGGGQVMIRAGDDAHGGGPGAAYVLAGNSTTAGIRGGNAALEGGPATVGDADGGHVSIVPGEGSGTGKAGFVFIPNLPTADPTVSNAIWSDNGVLVQSGHTAPSGGGSPQPGQPTRFLTLTYHHPGNEDGNGANESGIVIPDGVIEEGACYVVSVEIRAVKSSDGTLIQVGIGANRMVVVRPAGQTAISFPLGGSLEDHGASEPQSSAVAVSPEAEADSQFWFGSIFLDNANTLRFGFGGFSSNTPTDWKINVQLTPIAP